MRKVLLLLIIGLLGQVNIFAQSLEIIKPDGTSINKDTIKISTTDNSSDIEVPLYIKNISNNTLEAFVKLYVKEFATNSTAVYCWSSCFDISTTQSTSSLSVSAGDTIKDFHSTLSPNGNNGLTEIMYTFFVNKAEEDSASVTIIYDIQSTTDVDELLNIKESIGFYPNPVQNTLFLNYDAKKYTNCNISIYNIVGREIKSQKLDCDENSAQIDMLNVETGIYILIFKLDGEIIKSKKIIKK
ncbi:MAG: T9SS type A sorting domain-containing protein [Bacteroidales bacterium]|jgi:hypothetical protein|nr:T9SS type A sorting domain-containing protein [Bacteroidales bacterium]